VVTCPFGVVQRNEKDGRAFKCTFCYDRQKVGLSPACATACPTESIKFGEINELRLAAQERVEELRGKGMSDAQLYDASDTSVGGTHAMFVLRGSEKQYNLPPNPVVPTEYLRDGWKSSAIAGGILLFGTLFAFLGSGRQ
jgi:formate dehydrogenase iron-sulfur subunit